MESRYYPKLSAGDRDKIFGRAGVQETDILYIKVKSNK
tara:strand:- start:3839 stop:3952 length:114 start_codon:yes stop_codon:yes gene_type:complete